MDSNMITEGRLQPSSRCGAKPAEGTTCLTRDMAVGRALPLTLYSEILVPSFRAVRALRPTCRPSARRPRCFFSPLPSIGTSGAENFPGRPIKARPVLLLNRN